MKKINRALGEHLCQEAEASPRLRTNYNFHEQLSDPLQRLLNVMQPGTYVCPHKHQNPDKCEMFIILSGRAVVVEFNDQGEIADHFILSPEVHHFGVEIPPRAWHTIIPLAPNTMLFEAKEGPYLQNTDKNFASWAPREGDSNVPEYVDQLLKKLNISL